MEIQIRPVERLYGLLAWVRVHEYWRPHDSQGEWGFNNKTFIGATLCLIPSIENYQ